jgi:protein-disulfide isomerase
MDKKKSLSSSASEEETVTITFKRWHIFAALLPVVFLAGLLAGYLVWGRNILKTAGPAAVANNPTQAQNSTQSTNPTAIPTPKTVRYTVPVGDSPSIGAANAPVTIIEFADFECSYCQKWQKEVFPQLMSNYGDKIRFVYRNFPLSGHASAVPAANAAMCANDQGKYWEYHDKLFGMTLPLETASYQKYASDLGLDMTRFNDCYSNNGDQAKIKADVTFATSLGVDQTPTFFINGLAVLGAESYDFFKQVIDQELAGQIP